MTKKYTCHMHPEVVMDKRDKCSKWGMDLVVLKKKTKGKEAEKLMNDMKM